MLIGHQRILEFLKKSIANKKLAHAYLFTGPANVGKRKVAGEFIKILTGQEIEKKFHPDVLIIEPKEVEKKDVKKEKEITIDEARQIRRQISLFPYQSPYKIVLIDRAEKMTREAASALLKTLEEPSGKAILILITANPQLLLPTIVSRCQTIKFLPVPTEEIEKSLYPKYKIPRPTPHLNLGGGSKAGGQDTCPPEPSPARQDFVYAKSGGAQADGGRARYKKILRLSSGRPGLAIQYLEKPELLEAHHQAIKELQKIIQSDLNERYKEAEILSKNVISARQTLEQWLFYFHDALLSSVGCLEQLPGNFLGDSSNKIEDCSQKIPRELLQIIKAIQKTDLFLTNPSINARLALEVLMLEF